MESFQEKVNKRNDHLKCVQQQKTISTFKSTIKHYWNVY